MCSSSYAFFDDLMIKESKKSENRNIGCSFYLIFKRISEISKNCIFFGDYYILYHLALFVFSIFTIFSNEY